MDRDQLSELLRVERARRDLSLREVAAAAGTSVSVVSELERGGRNARYDTVRSVLGALGFELSARRKQRA